MSTKQWTLCVDFGTTYSSVAYHKRSNPASKSEPVSKRRKASQHARVGRMNVLPRDIGSIDRFPAAKGGHNSCAVAEVPTELWFSDDGTDRRALWGYQVQDVLGQIDATSGIRLNRIKLWLDSSERAKGERARNERATTQQKLESLNISIGDAITDYLTYLFKHTKARLIDAERFRDDDDVDILITIPAMWDPIALQITIASAERAARIAGLGHGKDILAVSEPEAAMAYVSEMKLKLDLEEGMTVLVCDAGGGTVVSAIDLKHSIVTHQGYKDLVSYIVKNCNPLDLSEIVAGSGACVGSSYITEAFEEKLSRICRSRKQMDQPMKIRDAIIQKAVDRFETYTKRNFGQVGIGDDQILLPGLKEDTTQGCHKDYLVMNQDFLSDLFQPQLAAIGSLVQDQIEKAARKGYDIQFILHVGGFAGSVALNQYLKRLTGLEPVTPSLPGAAVAHGGILRHLNLRHAISKRTRANFGFTQHEPYNPISHNGHSKAKTTVCKIDNIEYVEDCVRYFIKKNEEIPPGGRSFEFSGEPLRRITESLEDDLVLGFELFANEKEEVKDHYPVGHRQNQDCKSLGKIIYTIPKARLKELVEVKRAKPSKSSRCQTGVYYELRYRPVIKMHDTMIRYELWVGDTKAEFGMLNLKQLMPRTYTD